MQSVADPIGKVPEKCDLEVFVQIYRMSGCVTRGMTGSKFADGVAILYVSNREIRKIQVSIIKPVKRFDTVSCGPRR